MADSTHFGLSSDWNAAVDGDSLTNSANHGYDELIGLTGIGYLGIGRGSCPGSVVVVVADEIHNTSKFWELVLIHELSHNFGATHNWDATPPFPPNGYVMNGGENNYLYEEGWFVHWYTNVNEMSYDFN